MDRVGLVSVSIPMMLIEVSKQKLEVGVAAVS